MKAILLTILLFASTVISAQNVKFKSDYDGSSSTSFKFETALIEGKFSGNHQTISLKLKNTSDQPLNLNEGSIKLVDITGKGSILCGHGDLTIEPNSKITLQLSNCNEDSYRGLFQLRREYTDRKLFYEDASFLRNKTFELIIAGERIKFLTDL